MTIINIFVLPTCRFEIYARKRRGPAIRGKTKPNKAYDDGVKYTPRDRYTLVRVTDLFSAGLV